MNNDQFRRLVFANSGNSTADSSNGSSNPSGGGAATTRGLLGSRARPGIPMTSRAEGDTDAFGFARAKRAGRNAAESDQKKQKKPHSAVPKGSRLAHGYFDRAKARQLEEQQQQQRDDDQRLSELKALDESLKNGKIDRETYDHLRTKIAGGHLSSTHLVKGLDFKLLERVRNGEDVYSEKGGGSRPGEEEGGEEEEEEEGGAAEHEQAEAGADLDDELAELESTEVKAVTREKIQKKGQFAITGSLNPGQKRSRNQILAELKAAREAAAQAREQQQPALGSRFKKIGAKKEPGTRIERDAKGREVMIIIDEDGHERRKVRRLDPKARQQDRAERAREREALASGEVLGMEVPEYYKQKQLEKEQAEAKKELTMFEDIESDYDPLAGLEDEDEDEDDNSQGSDAGTDQKKARARADEDGGEDGEIRADTEASGMPPPPPSKATPRLASRDYFKDSKTALVSEETYKAPSANDAAFLASLKKAKAISAAEESAEEQKREARLKKMLADASRDDDDLDLGFGSSRVQDETEQRDEEGGRGKTKLSTWGEDDHDDDDDGGGKGQKRKKGSKKNKGDKSNLADVMRVMERNKEAAKQ